MIKTSCRNWRQHLQTTYSTKDLYPYYVKQNSALRKWPNKEVGQKTWAVNRRQICAHRKRRTASFASRKMQTKTVAGHRAHLWTWLRKTATPSAKEEAGGTSVFPVGLNKSRSRESSSVASHKRKCTLAASPLTHAQVFTLEKLKCVFTKTLHTGICGSSIHNHKTLGTSQIPFHWWMHPHGGNILSN